MLLCIAEDLYMDPCTAIDLFLNDQRICQLTESTGRTGTIIGNSEFLHHLVKILQDSADRIYDLRFQSSR